MIDLLCCVLVSRFYHILFTSKKLSKVPTVLVDKKDMKSRIDKTDQERRYNSVALGCQICSIVMLMTRTKRKVYNPTYYWLVPSPRKFGVLWQEGHRHKILDGMLGSLALVRAVCNVAAASQPAVAQ